MGGLRLEADQPLQAVLMKAVNCQAGLCHQPHFVTQACERGVDQRVALVGQRPGARQAFADGCARHLGCEGVAVLHHLQRHTSVEAQHQLSAAIGLTLEADIMDERALCGHGFGPGHILVQQGLRRYLPHQTHAHKTYP